VGIVGNPDSSAAPQLPEPSQNLGFRPGDDYKLADYSQIVVQG